jgi:hypothetical protein
MQRARELAKTPEQKDRVRELEDAIKARAEIRK